MAKVKHSQLVDFMSGRVDGSVLYAAPGQRFSISRQYIYPRLNANNHQKGLIMQNLAAVWALCHEDYKTDGQNYANRYYTEHLDDPHMKIPVNNNFGQWVKMCFAWYASDPEHIDLAEFTIADAVALDSDIRTWSRAVSAGFLPAINTYDDLTAGIQ